MARNLTRKILEAHLLEGSLDPGSEIAIRIDQTLLQDATGTMGATSACASSWPRVSPVFTWPTCATSASCR